MVLRREPVAPIPDDLRRLCYIELPRCSEDCMRPESDDDAPADLGEMEGEEPFDFPPAERLVVTQPVDLSVQTLIEQWGEKVLILPDIQREYVWDNGKASRLIESLVLNIPIPALYFAENQEAKYEIIDGHQRVRSIVGYVNNEFSLSGIAVLREYKGLRFHQLPEREQRFLKMRTLRTILISIDSHPNMRFEIYERLNTGAILLNAQELRNSIYRGPFNNLLHELAKTSEFRKQLIGTKVPRRRMVDEELILRFLSLHFELGQYPLRSNASSMSSCVNTRTEITRTSYDSDQYLRKLLQPCTASSEPPHLG